MARTSCSQQLTRLACLLLFLGVFATACSPLSHPNADSVPVSRLEVVKRDFFATRERGDFHEARRKGEEWLALAEQLFGRTSPEVTAALVNIGSLLLSEQADYPAAEAALRWALTNYELNPTAHTHPIGFFFFALGRALREQDKYAEAKDVFSRALLAHERELGPDHKQVGLDAFFLGEVLLRLGDLRAALPHLARDLVIRERHLGPHHRDLVPRLTLLGSLFRRQGDYSRAHELLERALDILEKQPTEQADTKAAVLADLATTLIERGDTDSALALLHRRLGIVQQLHGTDDLRVGAALLDVGDVLLLQDKIAEAHAFLVRSMGIYTRAMQERQLSASELLGVAKLRRIYSRIQQARNDVKGVRESLELSIRIYRTVNATWTKFDMALALFHFGRLLRETGHFEEAQTQYEESTRVLEDAVGHDQWNVAASLYERARLHWAQGRLVQAGALVREAKTIEERIMENALTGLSQRQRFAALRLARRAGLDFFLSVAAVALDPQSTYRGLLLWKNAAFHTGRPERPPRDVSDSNAAAVYEEFDAARRRLSRLAFGFTDQERNAEDRGAVAAALAEIERLERTLSRDSAEFRLRRQQARAGFADVCQSLPSDGVLLEYVWYALYEPPATPGADESWTPSYTVFAIPGDNCSRQPLRVDLGPAEPIDRLVKELRAGLKIGLAGLVPVPSVQERAHELGTLVLPSALRQQLKGKSRLVIAPDGMLALMPFALLPGDDAHEFLLETYTVSYIPSGRDLLAFDRAPPGTTTPRLLAVGNPAFGAMPETTRSRLATRAACTLNETILFDPLPGTGIEVAQIGRRAAGLASSAPVIVSGADATKERLFAEIANKTVLHLATHAYFAGEKCQVAGTPRDTRMLAGLGTESVGAVGEDPLLLSGLAMAGANRDPAQGILTALEVTTLDLRHVDLVVLSACDTGLGKLTPGQELLGLRWAFAYAGARNLVTSLWQVPDEPTAALMGQFYNRLWQQNLSSVAALREAQLARLRANRAAGDPRPWDWAAFTVSGPAK